MLCFSFVLLESSGRYGKAPNAFIFSLNNSESLAPFLSKVKPERQERQLTGVQILVQSLLRTLSFILMPTLSADQEQFWAGPTLFQLQ